MTTKDIVKISTRILILVILSVITIHSAFAAMVLNISLEEFTSETVAYNPIDNTESTSGTSQTGAALSDVNVNGQIIITNTGGNDLYGINITINGTSNMNQNFTIDSQPSYASTNFSLITPGQNGYIYIAQLQEDDQVVVNYTGDAGNVGEPLNITTSMAKTRVLTNSTVNVTMNITNNLNSGGALENIVVTKRPMPMEGTFGISRYFNYTPFGGNASTYVTTQDIIDADGGVYRQATITLTGSLRTGSTHWRHLSYIAHAPENINVSWNDSNWATWNVMGNNTISFSVQESLLGLDVGFVQAQGDGIVQALKSRHNTTHWREGINFTNPTNMTYNLTKFTVYGVRMGRAQDPGNVTQILGVGLNGTNITNTLTRTADLAEFDIDDDNTNDTFSISDDGHFLVINLTSQPYNITVALRNTTGNLSVSDIGGDAININMTNVHLNGFGYLTMHLSQSTANQIDAPTGDEVFFIYEALNGTVDNEGSFYTQDVAQQIDAAGGAGDSYQYYNTYFEYDLVPVVWADADFIVQNDGTQITREKSSSNLAGSYLYYEEILVMNGYIIKATKDITPHGVLPNIYNVSIVVENTGNEKTPDLVNVFDLIPPDFVIWFENNETNKINRNHTLNGIPSLFITPDNMTYGTNVNGEISNANSLYDNYSGFNVMLHGIEELSDGDGVFDQDNITVRMVDSDFGAISNASWTNIAIDLDDDGVTDQVRVNNVTSTSLEFNLSRAGIFNLNITSFNGGGLLNISAICLGGNDCTAMNFSVIGTLAGGVPLNASNGEIFAYIQINGSTDTNGTIPVTYSAVANDVNITDKENHREVMIEYWLNGTGQFTHIQSAYIVGIDPVRIDGRTSTAEVGSTWAGGSQSLENLVMLLTIISSAGVLALGAYINRRKGLL